MWSLPGRELLWSRDDVPTSWLAISPDGRYLATVGNTFEDGVPDGAPVTSTFTVWDLSTHAVHLSEDLTACQYQEPRTTRRPDHADAHGSGVLPRREQGCHRLQRLQGFVMIYDLALRRRTLQLPMFENRPVLDGLHTGRPATPGRQPGLPLEGDATTGEVLSLSLLPALATSPG